jgi:hypothetical protein
MLLLVLSRTRRRTGESENRRTMERPTVEPVRYTCAALAALFNDGVSPVPRLIETTTNDPQRPKPLIANMTHSVIDESSPLDQLHLNLNGTLDVSRATAPAL